MTDLAQKYPSAAGSFNGAPSPRKLAGKRYAPWYLVPTNSVYTLTPNQIYYTPFFNDQACTVAGMSFHEQGTGNTGRSARLGCFAESASGGPGALIKDVGVASCTGAAGERVAANSFLMPAGQIFLTILSASAVDLFGGNIARDDGVGRQQFGMPQLLLGRFGSMATLGIGVGPVGDFAALTYGALPDPATTPTGTVTATAGASGYWPFLQFYI